MTAIPKCKIGIEESEWRDDAEALADWESWLKTLDSATPSDEAIAPDRFDDEFRRFNIEAVRQQMREGPVA